MAELRIIPEWQQGRSGDPEISATEALLKIAIDDVCLTRCLDIGTRSVNDAASLSAYPLALWLATAWWRLIHEPLPIQAPSHAWRMAHELVAANDGFIWPRVVFIPDGEAMQVWSTPSAPAGQALHYFQGLSAPQPVALASFKREAQHFIETVLERLDLHDLSATDLAKVWNAVREDEANPWAARRRSLEAQFGFDPEECPNAVLEAALQWSTRVGEGAFSEVAPAIASASDIPQLITLDHLVHAKGIRSNPSVSGRDFERCRAGPPWERGVRDARTLRHHLGRPTAPLLDAQLHQLLGIASAGRGALVNPSLGTARLPVAVGIREADGRNLRLIGRRRNPVGQRFELARFLSEHLQATDGMTDWLVCTDIGTSRQKYQRAFAAELLCPLNALVEFLDGDYTSCAVEEAAAHFAVSDQLVNNVLMSNRLIHHPLGQTFPYRTGFNVTQ